MGYPGNKINVPVKYRQPDFEGIDAELVVFIKPTFSAKKNALADAIHCSQLLSTKRPNWGAVNIYLGSLREQYK